MNEFDYNGWRVVAIGPVVSVPGGYSQRVRIVDCPDYIVDKEFNAVVDYPGPAGCAD